MSAVLVLTGLQWLSLKPKEPPQVELEGEEVSHSAPGLPRALTAELQWVWDSLRSATRARSMVLFYKGRCLLQEGVAPAGQALGAATPGPICQKAMQSGTGNYLANLVLFPGRLEFAGYLPPNCQAALIQPVGKDGVLVVGSDTQRGFTRLDQAWVSTVADKLEVALERLGPGSGFKQQQ
ncbi:CGLD23 required for cyt b6 assembly [Chlorella sorokiniana]|uniref:CGLD23 required for cyt b6 assembly n=1 Tax=Chlorella sorokiniana TaxID=3076 RepID=A0A2P6U4A2_CHLSO|nr:CGLD23 required for cyt b6 assembly [Chlorella sorokiniana]|eukprot:PRW61129.1 CGLD23 required for cyt b6 assembly [Chlorella sorokiniana]